MLTNKRITLPNYSGDARKDFEALKAAIDAYLRSLEDKGALGIETELIKVQGLRFPATQVASSDVNTLDDYEEGTWTPTITASAGAFTTVSATGRYTKLGNTTTFRVTISIPTNGTAAGGIVFTLPFAMTDTTAVCHGRENNVVGFTVNGVAISTTTFGLTKFDGTHPGGDGFSITVQGFFS